VSLDLRNVTASPSLSAISAASRGVGATPLLDPSTPEFTRCSDRDQKP